MKFNVLPFFSLATPLKFFSVFPDYLVEKKSLVYLLFLYRYAQSNRRLYFTYCCALSTLFDVKFRFFINFYQRFWIFAFLFFPKFNKQYLHMFEAQKKGIHLTKFSSSFFHKIFLNSYAILSYKNFFLRIDFMMFGFIWKALEGVRALFYNHYMRYHFFINKWKYLQTWRGFTQIISHNQKYGKTRFSMAARFFIGLKGVKYRIFLLRGLQTTTNYYLTYKLISNKEVFSSFNAFFPFLRSFSSLSLMYFLNIKYFRRILYLWLLWIIGTIITRYAHLFQLQSRWDYDSAPQMFKIIAGSPYSLGKAIALWVGHWEQKIFQRFFSFSPDFFLFLFNDLLILLESRNKEDYFYYPGFFPRKFIFFYRPSYVAVNNYFDVRFFAYFMRKAMGHSSNWIFSSWWSLYKRFFILNPLFFDYSYFGNFYKIGLNLFQFVITAEHIHWRIYSNSAVYLFLAGQLQLPFLYKKIELDYLIYYRYRLLWRIFSQYMKSPVLGLYKNDQPKRPLKKVREDFWLAIPLPFSKIIKVAMKNWRYNRRGKRKISRTSLRLMIFIFLSIFTGIFVEIFMASVILSYLTFFFLSKNYFAKYYFKWSYNQCKLLMGNYVNHFAARNWILTYKFYWSRYRRFTVKQGIHSFNDPKFHEIWMIFFHKMRRTGFKKEDLAYYCYEKNKDFLPGLVKKIVPNVLTPTAFKKFKGLETVEWRRLIKGEGKSDRAQRFVRRHFFAPPKKFIFSNFIITIPTYVLFDEQK